MRRIGRLLAALAVTLPFCSSGVTLTTVAGCSGSSGIVGQSERNEEADKVGQDKMKEYMAKKSPAKGKKR